MNKTNKIDIDLPFWRTCDTRMIPSIHGFENLFLFLFYFNFFTMQMNERHPLGAGWPAGLAGDIQNLVSSSFWGVGFWAAVPPPCSDNEGYRWEKSATKTF